MDDRIIADIAELVRCESPALAPETSAPSADAVARLGRALLGVEPERVIVGAFHHLVWRLGGGPTRVLLLAHHDTVWPLGSLASHPFTVAEGVLRGPGCFDMKAGIVMALHAVAALDDATGVAILVTGDEELGSPTSRGLIEAEATGCDAVLVLEASATGGAMKTRRKGASLYRLEVRGRAAHAGLEPEAGINAAVELAHQVLAIAALSDAERGTSVTPTVLAGGSTMNTVPATASVAVDVRMWDADEQERVDVALRNLQPALPGAELALSGGPNRAPLESSASADLFRRISELAVSLGQPAPAEAAVGGASDGNFTAGIGIPTLDGLGAIGGGAHADDEHVLLAGIPARIELITALIADLLASARTASVAEDRAS